MGQIKDHDVIQGTISCHILEYVIGKILRWTEKELPVSKSIPLFCDGVFRKSFFSQYQFGILKVRKYFLWFSKKLKFHQVFLVYVLKFELSSQHRTYRRQLMLSYVSKRKFQIRNHATF